MANRFSLSWIVVGLIVHTAIAKDYPMNPMENNLPFQDTETGVISIPIPSTVPILLAKNTHDEPVWISNQTLTNDEMADQNFLMPTDRTRKNLLGGIKDFSKKRSTQLQKRARLEKTPRARELLQYWNASVRLPKMTAQEITTSLEYFTSPVLSQKYRSAAILRAGKIKAWFIVKKLYAELSKPGREQQCYAVLADLAISGNTDVLTTIGFKQWDTNTKPQQACHQVNREIMIRRLKDEARIQTRIRLMLYTDSRRDFRSLPANAMFALPSGFSKKLFFKSSSNLLNHARKITKRWRTTHKTERYRLWMLAVIAKLSPKTPKFAAQAYKAFERFLSTSDQKIAHAYIGLGFAADSSDQAIPWLNYAEEASAFELWPKYQLTIIRAYLRASQWEKVIESINRLPYALQSKTVWRYWWARSILEVTANQDASLEKIHRWLAVNLDQPENKDYLPAVAAQTLQSISRENDFYGALAAEWLGQSLYIPPVTIASNPAEMAEVQKNGCLKWAAYLIHLGDRIIRRQGVSEWKACIKGMNDRQLLAVSRFALSLQIFDRAINTAIQTKYEHDWQLRFLTPFWDFVNPYAQQRDIPIAWIYGLIRQESRFIINAASSVGAQGLMQIMPKTGRWLAKKVGLKPFRTSMLNDMETNVRLGTYYMKRLFDRFNHPILVSTAYNAGPSRAQRWRPSGTTKSIDAAVYAEIIPFTETRGYVKNVLWNTTVYQILLGNTQAKISDWLPSVTNLTIATQDLP